MTDYIDTGLFLDHRITRQMVRDEARDKRFLNLFGYTGSFSVYAASGGARATCTVDWSNTYLNWARDNMRLNHFSGIEHQFVNRDAVRFVHELYDDPTQHGKFDLVVVDPPTFSNSKRTDEIWDVQKHHAQLLNLLFLPLATGSTIFFSTNFRKFKLASSELTQYKIVEISNQTVPEDFRNRRIHRCWKLIKPK
jgi:23S rRNA G2069 N7-methylase RlmK/C1962 C5-methylase RlmI